MGVIATSAGGALATSTAAAALGGTPAARLHTAARMHTATSLWALAGIPVGQRGRSPAIALSVTGAALHLVNGAGPAADIGPASLNRGRLPQSPSLH